MGLQDKNKRLVKANRMLREEAGVLVQQLEGASAAYRNALQENAQLQDLIEKLKASK